MYAADAKGEHFSGLRLVPCEANRPTKSEDAYETRFTLTACVHVQRKTTGSRTQNGSI
jgi:hypothetical protein